MQRGGQIWEPIRSVDPSSGWIDVVDTEVATEELSRNRHEIEDGRHAVMLSGAVISEPAQAPEQENTRHIGADQPVRKPHPVVGLETSCQIATAATAASGC